MPIEGSIDVSKLNEELASLTSQLEQVQSNDPTQRGNIIKKIQEIQAELTKFKEENRVLLKKITSQNDIIRALHKKYEQVKKLKIPASSSIEGSIIHNNFPVPLQVVQDVSSANNITHNQIDDFLGQFSTHTPVQTQNKPSKAVQPVVEDDLLEFVRGIFDKQRQNGGGDLFISSAEIKKLDDASRQSLTVEQNEFGEEKIQEGIEKGIFKKYLGPKMSNDNKRCVYYHPDHDKDPQYSVVYDLQKDGKTWKVACQEQVVDTLVFMPAGDGMGARVSFVGSDKVVSKGDERNGSVVPAKEQAIEPPAKTTHRDLVRTSLPQLRTGLVHS